MWIVYFLFKKTPTQRNNSSVNRAKTLFSLIGSLNLDACSQRKQVFLHRPINVSAVVPKLDGFVMISASAQSDEWQ